MPCVACVLLELAAATACTISRSGGVHNNQRVQRPDSRRSRLPRLRRWSGLSNTPTRCVGAMGACTLGPTCGRSSLCNGCETPVYACIVLYACCSSSSRQPHIWLAARRVCTATCATCNATGHLHVQCHALSCSASLAYEEEKHGACGWMEGADCAGTQRVHVVPTTRGTRLSSGARLAAVAGRYTWSAALEVCTTPSCARPGSGALTSLAYEDKRRGGCGPTAHRHRRDHRGRTAIISNCFP
jgi:hypothetical protein